MSLPSAKGILVVGTGPRAGKTILAAGLSGALYQLGYHVEPAKPLGFYPPISWQAQQEQMFFQRVVRLSEWQEPIQVPSAYDLTPKHWQLLLENMRRRVYPVIMEAPATVAGTVAWQGGRRLDVADLAGVLGLSVLLVTPKQPDPGEWLLPPLAYLAQKRVDVAGWIGMEARPAQAPLWETEALAFSRDVAVPYLGTVPHDPTLSLETQEPGRLLDLVADNIDLLPLQETLQLMVP